MIFKIFSNQNHSMVLWNIVNFFFFFGKYYFEMFAYILEHNPQLHNKSTPSKPALKSSLFSQGKLVVNE